MTGGDFIKGLLVWAPVPLVFGAVGALVVRLFARKNADICHWAVISGTVPFAFLVSLAFTSHHLANVSNIEKHSIFATGFVASLVVIVWGGAGRVRPISISLLAGLAALCAAVGWGFEDAYWTGLRAALHNIELNPSEPYGVREIEKGSLVILPDGKLARRTDGKPDQVRH
jgi:hypothetical protein